MNNQVRVRFAPSPTGPLHIGGVRTALYNYLFARKHGGVFIIRIEDTDQSRYVPGAEEYIFESLSWLGINPDESPVTGGPYIPYRQSERKAIYREYADKLILSGNAYYAFDSPEELEQAREKAKSHGHDTFQYNSVTRTGLKNSLSLPPAEVKKMINEGVPYVIRLKIPENEEIRFKDEIRGWVVVNSASVDDKVLMKSDGMPTYHLANVVDDHIMKITHVIRGEEWLPSAPIHWLLYKYFGWMDTMPVFAHLPLLLKPEGTGKLSKRDADKGGFPIFPVNWKDPVTGDVSIGFREQGYLPEATINFLALLGWNPGTEKEMFNMKELTEAFSVERVNKSGAKFDIEKAKFFNQHYIKDTRVSVFIPGLKLKLDENKISYDPDKLEQIIEVLRERVTFPEEFYTKSLYFFKRPDQFDPEVIRKKFTPEMAIAIRDLGSVLKSGSHAMKAEEFREIIGKVMEKNGIQPGQSMQLIRVFVTGSTTGIDLMQTLEFLGPGEVAERLIYATEKFA
jgi:glutamyl-tRNA synthetase